MIVSSYEANDTLTRALERLADYERTNETNLLLYAALETRLCIERTLFEYLVLIRSGDVPRKLERLRRVPGGAWPRPPRTWSSRSSPGCRRANGSSRCLSPCGIGWPHPK